MERQRIGSVMKGIQKFSRAETSRIKIANPVGEAVWLARRAVKEDKRIMGIQGRNVARDAKLYFHRLREMGSIFAEVFAFQEYLWEPKTKNPRIFDFGSDVGGFTVMYWKSVAPQSKVTLVEANPSTATVVAENFKRKGLGDVEVINAAVSGRDGHVDLHLSGYNPSNFAGDRKKPDGLSYRTLSVPTVRASNLIGDERVDLLKMDIEGFEGEVLRDLAETGKLRQVDQIMMEFHNDPSNPGNSLDEVLEIFANGDFIIGNIHVSGIDRVLNNRPIDIDSIQPSDVLLFSFTGKRLGSVV